MDGKPGCRSGASGDFIKHGRQWEQSKRERFRGGCVGGPVGRGIDCIAGTDEGEGGDWAPLNEASPLECWGWWPEAAEREASKMTTEGRSIWMTDAKGWFDKWSGHGTRKSLPR